MGQPDPDFFKSLFASPNSNQTSSFWDALAKASLPERTPASGIGSLFGAAIQPQPPKPEAIRFYRDGGDMVEFMEPRPFSWQIPQPAWAGLYAILVADNSWKPRFFRPLYFGETENLAERPTTSHEHYQDWCTAAGGAANLHVAYCWMMSSTKDERTAIESGLIKFYKPECNTVYRHSLSWLARATQNPNPFVPGVPSGYGSLLDVLSRIKRT